MRSVVLFDLDGTLTDPKPGITRCIAHALERMGFEAPDCEHLTWCIGPPLGDSFPRLLGSDDPELIRQAIEFYRERFRDVGLFENAVYDGVPEMLAVLRSSKRLLLATSKLHVFAERILVHFGLRPFFDAVYGSELDGARADKGELIAYALACEGLPPEESVMVGDREHDVLGAARNRVPCVGVTYGYGGSEELTRAGAVALCGRPDKVPNAVNLA